MSQISRQREAEISNGNIINADDIGAELDPLVSESNVQDTRITSLESGNVTISGKKVFTTAPDMNQIDERTADSGVTIDSVRCKDGMVKVAGTPAEGGEIGYAANVVTFHDGSVVKTLATTADLLVAVPSVSGNSGKLLGNNGSATSWTTPPFTVYNLSSNVTITAAGAWSVTHGLGMAPKGIQLWLKCTSTELNYSVGDMVMVSSDNAHGTSDLGSAAAILTGNTTTINGRFGSSANTFVLGDKTSGTNNFITNSKWALVVASWA